MGVPLPLRPTSFSVASRSWAPTPVRRDAIEVETLGLVTLNAWFEPFEAARRADALVDLVAASDADLICLQEVTPSLAQRLRGTGAIQDEMEMVCSGSVYDAYGLVVLSRLPLARAWEIELPSVMNRSLLVVELATTDGPLRVATVHLESTRVLAATRMAQLHEVFTMLDEGVLVGDFNFDPRDPEEAALDPRFVDLWPLLRPSDPGYTEDTTRNRMRFEHHGRREKHVRYDRVLARLPGWRARSIELFATEPLAPGVHVSDHFGIVAHFVRTR